MTIAQNASPFSLRARWVFPVAAPPLRDAAVTICQGRIVAVGSPPHDVPIEDLGQAAIVPGLVNAQRIWNSAIWSVRSAPWHGARRVARQRDRASWPSSGKAVRP